MENETITNVPENTFHDACPEYDNLSHPQRGFKGFLQKLTKLSWKAWLIIAVVTALLIGGGLFLYNRLTNTYKTPLDRYVEYRNSRNYSADAEIAMLNGFVEEEFNLFDLCRRLSEDDLESREEEFAETVKYLEKEYGKDYKFYYKIDRKSKLDRDEINDFEDSLKAAASDIRDVLGNFYEEEFLTVSYDLDEKKLEEFADARDLTLLQAKLYLGAMKNLRKELENVKVTEGYELSVTVILKGGKLDEPLEQETTLHVYKVDGRWICKESLENVFSSIL